MFGCNGLRAVTDPDKQMLQLNRRDRRLTDHLLDGRAELEGLSDGWRRAAALIEVARRPASYSDDEGGIAEIAHLTSILRKPAAAGRPPVRRPRRAGRITVLVAGLIVGASGTAAAASNRLPDSLQSFVSDAASHVGINVPAPDDGRDGGGATTANEPTGPPTSQPGASAGAAGNDSRPACAGNPSSDPAGCGAATQESSRDDHSADSASQPGDKSSSNPPDRTASNGGSASASEPPTTKRPKP